jgi:hypothetical protein
MYNLTQEQKKHYLEYGYLIVEDFLPVDVANKLLSLHKKAPYWAFTSHGCEELGPELDRFQWNTQDFDQSQNEYGQVDSRDVPEDILEKINKIKQYHLNCRNDHGWEEDIDYYQPGYEPPLRTIEDAKAMGQNCWEYAPHTFMEYKHPISKQIQKFNYEVLVTYLAPIHHSLQTLSLSKLTDDIESNRHYLFDFIWSKYDYLSYIGNHSDVDFEWVKKHKHKLEKYQKNFLNSGIYLNENWNREYGGQLCFQDLQGNVVEVEPKFNTYVGWSQTPNSDLHHCVTPVQHKTRSRRAVIMRDDGEKSGNNCTEFIDKNGKYHKDKSNQGRNL